MPPSNDSVPVAIDGALAQRVAALVADEHIAGVRARFAEMFGPATLTEAEAQASALEQRVNEAVRKWLDEEEAKGDV